MSGLERVLHTYAARWRDATHTARLTAQVCQSHDDDEASLI
jgi:hypothetical protein